MNYHLEEISGTEYQTLEACQQSFLIQLARLLANLIRDELAQVRQNQELLEHNCDKIELKLLEVNDV